MLMQTRLRRLIANGQFEFISGGKKTWIILFFAYRLVLLGWCQNDEVTTTYEDTIDQMTEGHQFLYNTFGITPKIAWQVGECLCL